MWIKHLNFDTSRYSDCLYTFCVPLCAELLRGICTDYTFCLYTTQEIPHIACGKEKYFGWLRR
jgi:hypothetical protein